MDSKDDARRVAEDMKGELESVFSGSKWEVRVWHNLRWCSAVFCGHLSVFEMNGRYTAYCNSRKGRSGTDAYWHGETGADTPHEAVEKAVSHARTHVNKVGAVIASIEETLGLGEVIHEL